MMVMMMMNDEEKRVVGELLDMKANLRDAKLMEHFSSEKPFPAIFFSKGGAHPERRHACVRSQTGEVQSGGASNA